MLRKLFEGYNKKLIERRALKKEKKKGNKKNERITKEKKKTIKSVIGGI